MIGITQYGSYIPRLRLDRKSVVQANAWYAPSMKAKGHRAMSNWDEDSLTMAVEASRDALGASDDRSNVSAIYLASTTLPFADRLNSAVAKEALTLNADINAVDITGTQRAGLSAIVQAVTAVRSGARSILVAAADKRKALAAGSQELDIGDGAGAILIGSQNVVAEFLGTGVVTEDFVDHFRAAQSDFDYTWEERWIREEGIGKLVPRAVKQALQSAGIEGGAVDHFIFPTTIRGIEKKLATDCGIKPESFRDNLSDRIGDTGTAHALLILAATLESAKPGQLILVAKFGQGAEACVFRVTDAINSFRPRLGVTGCLEAGVPETSYTKFLAFQGLLQLDKGMRAEQDKKTALTTLYRNRSMILGLVAGRCRETGAIHFPPSRLSVVPGHPLLDTQEPYKLAERHAKVLSWSADFLSYCPSPPNHYGYMDFEGGGRFFMEIADVAQGEVDTGMLMRMSFRIKDIDDRRGFKRYFWKAVPVKPNLANR